MLMFNADGSTAGACGNATRCVARLLFEQTGKSEGVIETVAGLLHVSRVGALYAVDFGPPRLDWTQIPLASTMDTKLVDVGLPALPPACCVSMGNPHAVFFVPDVMAIDLADLGPQIEHHPLFPQRTNVEFAQILGKDRIRMRVWERGTGITEACGSGACATLVAAARCGLAGRQADIILDGGTLNVLWRETDDHVVLTGPAALAYTGTFGDYP
jgi:diaminopimelate epimerase